MRIENSTIGDFLRSLGEKTPTPGGGAVAALTQALAAALGQMVVNYSIGKKTLAAFDKQNRTMLEQLEAIGQRSLTLAEADMEAYARLNELWKLPADDPRRMREFDTAVQAAIDAPQAMLESAVHAVDLLGSLTSTTNPILKSDLAIAAVLAEAAARAAAWNVRINLPQLTDATRRRAIDDRVNTMLKHVATLCHNIENACAIRID